MLEITHPQVARYLEGLLPEREPLLQELEAYARAHDVPIIGPHGGAFLFAVTRLARARRILEVGTAIGYSGLWFARASAPWQGHITTIELEPETAERARETFRRAGVAARVEVVVGDALEAIEGLAGPFDLVFLDGDKAQYRPLAERLLPRLEPGGALLADNVLWSGRVASPQPDATTRQLQAFNRFLAEHPQLDTVFVPLRDGISLSLKREAADPDRTVGRSS